MEDIPQPADRPYTPGDRVRVHLDPKDPDSEYHGVTAEVVDVFEDSLCKETGRELDGHTYRVESLETGDVLPVEFRHADLVPVD